VSHLQKYRISPDFYKGTEPAEDGYLYQVEDADQCISRLKELLKSCLEIYLPQAAHFDEVDELIADIHFELEE